MNIILNRRYKKRLEETSKDVISEGEAAVKDRTPRISIIILNWNKLEFTRKCIDSIERNTSYQNYEIILFDNGSTEPGTKEYLSSLKHRTVMSPVNLGFARGNNRAAAAADGDLLVFLNNDIEAHGGWLEEMLRTYQENPSSGIIGSKLVYPDGTLQHMGVTIGRKGNGFHPYKRYPADIPPAMKVNECEAVTGACLLVRREIFLRVGGFDEQFLHGSEDMDLCLKVRSLGLKVYYSPLSVLTHYEQVSFREIQSSERKKMTRRNSRQFLRKWGPGLDGMRLTTDFMRPRQHYSYSCAKAELSGLIPADAAFILDAGCNSGLQKMAFAKSPAGRTVWGIEANEVYAKEAERYLDRVIVKDPEKDARLFEEDVMFDCIVCADMIGQFRDPWTVLGRLSRHLKPHGSLVCSIPNIQYYKAVMDIAADNWLYRPDGFPDINHQRFFSLHTITNLFMESGYEVVRMERDVKASRLMKLINAMLFGSLNKFLARQYLIVCRRRSDA
jgi:O-antigen biosynthesis protein